MLKGIKKENVHRDKGSKHSAAGSYKKRGEEQGDDDTRRKYKGNLKL